MGGWAASLAGLPLTARFFLDMCLRSADLVIGKDGGGQSHDLGQRAAATCMHDFERSSNGGAAAATAAAAEASRASQRYWRVFATRRAAL